MLLSGLFQDKIAKNQQVYKTLEALPKNSKIR